MARDRHATQILASQKNDELPPTRQIQDGFCRLVLPDVETMKQLGRGVEPRPKCPGQACGIKAFLATCTKPVELEIGSGMGRFLVARATNHPDTHFLGLELEEVRIAKTDVAARMLGLTNLNLIWAEAMVFLEFCLPDASIRAVYLFFPDPWLKWRHRKKRIFNPPFIDQIHRVLQPGGVLHAATDDAPYFTQMREVMAGETRFTETEPLKRTEDELTDFELKFLSKNTPTNLASWRKNDN